MSLRQAKKADLSLSTNAIVIMIIAITILGLALGFTRGVFTKLGDEIAKIGGRTVIEVPPTSQEPLTLTSTNVDIQRGKDYAITAAVYNKWSEFDPSGVEIPLSLGIKLTTCMGEDGMNHGPNLDPNLPDNGIDNGYNHITIVRPGRKTIPLNDYASFAAKLIVNKVIAPGTYVCTIVAESADKEYVSKDIMITVTA